MAQHPRLFAVVIAILVIPVLSTSSGVAASAQPATALSALSVQAGGGDGDDEGDEEEGDEEAVAANPLDLAIPYYGELETKFTEGWTLLNCASLTVPEPVVFECTPESLKFSTASYDPEFGTVLLAAEMSNAGRVVTVHYKVTLALPAVPVASEVVVNVPVSAGTALSLAHSELGIACDGCREKNVHLEVVGVEPATAGVLRVNDTHLVFASDPDYRGAVTLTYRVQDEQKQWSEPIAIEGFVSEPGNAPLLPLHLRVAMPVDEPLELTTAQLVIAADDDDALSLIDCGEAVFGTVSCIDGVLRYTPPLEKTGADQFTALVYAESGEQVRATVTVVRGDPPDQPGLAGGMLALSADSLLPSAVPVAEDELPAGATPSVFAPFVSLLERRRE